MDTLLLDDVPMTGSLVEAVHRSAQPVVLNDGTDECLVAMSPIVFERILFDSALLNAGDRRTLRF